MLARLLKSAETFGIDCGSHKICAQQGSADISAMAVVALLCHAFPMHMVLSVRTASPLTRTQIPF